MSHFERDSLACKILLEADKPAICNSLHLSTSFADNESSVFWFCMAITAPTNARFSLRAKSVSEAAHVPSSGYLVRECAAQQVN